MNVEQCLNWIIDGLKFPSKISTLAVMEKAYELESKILSNEASMVFSNDTVSMLRAFRCQRSSSQLEKIYELYDMQGRTVICTLATVLFNIEVLLIYRLRVYRWNDEIESNTVVEFTDLLPANKAHLLITEPERQSLRMPMSQLVSNLKRLVENSNNGCVRKHMTIDEFDDVVEALFDRVVLFSTLHLSEDDCDMVDYRLPTMDKEMDLFKTNFLFLSEMRLYFDTLFEYSLIWRNQAKWFTNNPNSSRIDEPVMEKNLKTFLATYCENFEREYFLEQFADYVLDCKLNSRLLTQLYRNKYPEVLRPDSRRIVKHFMGVGALVDYSGIQHISDLFQDESVDFAYEFTVFFYLRMIHEEDPMSTGDENKKGYMVQNPMNPQEYTYFNRENGSFTPYGTFLETVSHYFNSGHSAVRELSI